MTTTTLSSPPESRPSSRRALLAGALGGLGALAASAIGRASPVRAGVDGDVVLGALNAETATTIIMQSGADDALVVGALGGAGLFAQNTSPTRPALIGSGGGGAAGVQGSVGGTFVAGPANVGVVGNTSAASAPTFIGVLGAGGDGTGVKGTSSSGPGVVGNSGSGIGVTGNSTSSVGVRGASGATNQPGTVGWSRGNATGLLGYTNDGSGSLPAAKAKTAVYGQAAADLGVGVWGKGASTLTSNSLGVLGEGDTGVVGIGTFGVLGSAAAAGIGVYGSVSDTPGVPSVFGKTGLIGQTDAGGTAIVGFTGLTAPVPPPDTGIYGRSDTGGAAGRGLTGFCAGGIGLLGQTNTGVGVRAYSGTNTGVALRVTGKAAFDRSGKLTISSGHASGAKTGIALSSASFVLATLQTNVAGLFIQAVVTNPGGSSFTIYLNKAPTVNVVVAWLAVN